MFCCALLSNTGLQSSECFEFLLLPAIDLCCKEGKHRSSIFIFKSIFQQQPELCKYFLLKIPTCFIFCSLVALRILPTRRCLGGCQLNALRGNTLKCVVNPSKLYVNPDTYERLGGFRYICGVFKLLFAIWSLQQLESFSKILENNIISLESSKN